MINYKETYEGRLPYALNQYHVEEEMQNSYEPDFSYLKKMLLKVALSASSILKK